MLPKYERRVLTMLISYSCSPLFFSRYDRKEKGFKSPQARTSFSIFHMHICIISSIYYNIRNINGIK